jgi:hypothetical protein
MDLYGHQLHRYQEYLQQARHPTIPAKHTVPAPDNSPAKAQVAGAAAGSDIEQQILESVSKPGQKRAHSLLKHLKKSSVFTWSPEGEISYRGQAIPQSTIVNLMTEAQRQKPLKNCELPPGFDEFAQALKETNTAKAWLTNPALIKAMEKPVMINTPKPVEESGFHEASLDQPFYETTRRMTSPYVKKPAKRPRMR